jgi:hypothetical protein
VQQHLLIDGSNTKILGRRGRARVEMEHVQGRPQRHPEVNHSTEKTSRVCGPSGTRLKEIVSELLWC